MNILLVDNDPMITSLLKQLEQIKKYNIFFSDNLEVAKKIYKQNNIFIVIVDFDKNFGSDFLQYIEKNHPTQRVITMSRKFLSSDKLGARHCVKQYNKRRLMKPLVIHDLSEYIKDFDNKNCIFCDTFQSAESFLDNLDYIIKGYMGVSYDKENRTITTKNQMILLDFVDYLQDIDDLDFQVLDETTIELKQSNKV